MTYLVRPQATAESRLVVKVLIRQAPGVVGALAAWLLPWADLVMMRKQLLTLKQLAEEQLGMRRPPFREPAHARFQTRAPSFNIATG